MEPGSEKATAAEFLPSGRSLRSLRSASAECRGCGLYENATQTVFGRGPRDARLVVVGEQPGDREDREGEPFVGPAGRILAESLEEAEIARDDVYVTNAVKHFKWRQGRGKRRLHQRPSIGEVMACRPWLAAEVEAISPALVLCLGAIATRSVIGTSYRVTRDRGAVVETELGVPASGTIHPSAVLRIDDGDERRLARREFVRDLERAASAASL